MDDMTAALLITTGVAPADDFAARLTSKNHAHR
jgi:hypothetical protein